MSRILYHNGQRVIEGLDWLDLGPRDIAVHRWRQGDIFVLDDVPYNSGIARALDHQWYRVALETVDSEKCRKNSMKEAGLWTAVLEMKEAVEP